TGTQGVNNPPVPTLGTAINQTSMARFVRVNSIDDFCLFAPPTLANISDTETFEVAWCTKPRNNARVIPDGTITGVSFLKTPFYVQLMGTGDFTKLNIPQGDFGGELDPHGAYGAGNPVGGNVTTNVVDGEDEPIAEWMLYIDYNQFCIRLCTSANSTYSAAFMCWHELDEMGCEFVMPGTYNPPGTLYAFPPPPSCRPPPLLTPPRQRNLRRRRRLPAGLVPLRRQRRHLLQHLRPILHRRLHRQRRATHLVYGRRHRYAQRPVLDAEQLELRDDGDGREWDRAGEFGGLRRAGVERVRVGRAGERRRRSRVAR
ncbi:hypothetical protein C8F04DRAFT_965799, partial [Mycena alexandri]